MKSMIDDTLQVHYEQLLQQEKNVQLEREFALNCATSLLTKGQIIHQSLQGKSMKSKLIEVARIVKHRRQSPYLNYFRESAKKVKTIDELLDIVALSEEQHFDDIYYMKAVAKKALQLGDLSLAIKYLKRVLSIKETFEQVFNLSVFYLLEGNQAQSSVWYDKAMALYDEKKHATFFAKDGYRKYVIRKTDDYTLEFYKWRGKARGAIAAFDTIELTYKQGIFAKYYVNNQQLDIVALRRNRLNYFYENLTQKDYTEMTAHIFEQYDQNYAYGTSLAGYCSVYYGSVIPNVRILAFAPRNSGHPHYGTKRKIIFTHALQLPTVEAPVTLLLDPKNTLDWQYYNEQLKPALQNVQMIPVPYAGHRVLRYLKETGVLRQTYETFFAHKPVSLGNAHQHRHESPEYFAILAEQLISHAHYKWAVGACDRSLALLPDFDRALYQKSVALRALGRLEEATESLERALAVDTSLIKVTYLLTDIYNELGCADRSVKLLQKLSKRHRSKSLTNRLKKAKALLV